MASAPLRSSSPASARAPWRLLALGALVAALAGFGRLLPAYFAGDDFAFVGRYASFPFSAWPGLFTRTWQAGLFSVDLREIRPLNALAFMLDARLWHAAPAGFRLTNLLLHAGSAALVGAIAWEFTRTRRVALLALALFAFHPLAAPAAGWITGRVDVLATFFMLLAALAWLRFRLHDDARGGTLAVFALSLAGGLFTKESALVFPGLAVVLDLALDRERRPAWRTARAWAPYLALAAVLAVYAGCRFLAFGVAGPDGVGRGLPDLSRTTFYFDLARRQSGYLAHLCPPSAGWLVTWRDAGHPHSGALFLRVAALALVLASAAVAFGRWFVLRADATLRRRVICLGAGWYLVTTLPLIATYFSARHLYPTVAGWALAVALLGHALLPAARRFAAVAIAAVLALAALQHAAVSGWLAAARQSRAISATVQSVAREAETGTIVFIDVPDMVQGAWCWSWAVPHALRPPFAPTALDTRIVPVARPAAFAYREDWRSHLPLEALAQNSRSARLVRIRADGTVDTLTIPAERVRAAIASLTPSARLDDDARWRRFVASLITHAAP